jgi:hypothetical protein
MQLRTCTQHQQSHSLASSTFTGMHIIRTLQSSYICLCERSRVYRSYSARAYRNFSSLAQNQMTNKVGLTTCNPTPVSRYCLYQHLQQLQKKKMRSDDKTSEGRMGEPLRPPKVFLDLFYTNHSRGRIVCSRDHSTLQEKKIQSC